MASKTLRNFQILLRRAAFGVGVAITLVGCGDNSTTSSGGPEPVVITPSHVDLGGIENGTSKWAEFSIQNNSPQPITIKNLTSSCGCTAAEIDANSIAPGQSAVLKVEMSNHSRFGRFGAKVEIDWANIDRNIEGTLAATTQADAYQLAIVNPGTVDFGTILTDANEIDADIEIRQGNSPKLWSSVEIKVDSPNLSAIASPKRDDDSTSISVKFDPANLPQGRFRDTLMLRFFDESGKPMGERSIPVQTLVDGPVEIKPASLYFGVIESDSSINGEIAIRSRDGSPVEIVRIEAFDLAESLIFGEPDRASGRTSLPYSFKSPAIEGNVSATVEVTVLSNKGESVLEIPVICFISG